MHHLVTFYLFSNKLMWQPSWLSIGNLCLISDMTEVQCGGCNGTFINNDFVGYPVAVLISPYASKTEIIDFINKLHKPQIEPLQKKFRDKKIKIGKVRTKKQHVQARNDYIYEHHRNVPYKQLSVMVTEKFGEILGYDGIASVVALEKRRRKNL